MPQKSKKKSGILANLRKQQKTEAALSYELVSAMHEGLPTEKIAEITSSLDQVVELPMLLPIAMTSAMYADIGVETPLDKKWVYEWFIPLENKVMLKHGQYGIEWPVISACMLSVVGDPNIAQHIPRDWAIMAYAMTLEAIIDKNKTSEEGFKETLKMFLVLAKRSRGDMVTSS